MPHAHSLPRDPILANAPVRIGSVTLTVRDLDRLVRFYQDALGLAVLAQDGSSATLGVGGSALLILRHEPAARPWSQREPGLFHTAFLLPSREDLGAWLRHVTARSISIAGASDHVVSEAVYLSDPEGNGIEVYVDRPSTAWQHADGLVVMRNDRLDLDGLMASSADGRWTCMPEGSRVGHVHLQVGDLPLAEAFYGDLLGLSVMARYSGATFWGVGGYHHQLATNVWNSRCGAPRTDLTSGLAEIELLADGEGVIEATRARLDRGGQTFTDLGADFVTQDPWNTALRFTLVRR